MNKVRITIRLDKDVVDFFTLGGSKGYQSRLNQALREYIKDSSTSLEDKIRKVIKEELANSQVSHESY